MVEVVTENEGTFAKFADWKTAILDQIIERGAANPKKASGLSDRKRGKVLHYIISI